MKKDIKIFYIANFLNKGMVQTSLAIIPFIQQDLKFDIFWVGFITSIFSFVNTVSAAFSGFLITRLEIKKSLLLSMFFITLSWLTISFTTNIPILIMAYVFGALCSSTFETLIGIFISKVVSKEERATQFGNSGALGDLGRVSISALTVLLITIPSIGWINAARLNATITLTYSIFIFIFFKYNIPIRDASVKLDTNFKQILSNTKLVLVTITSSFDTFASLSLYIFIPYLLMGKGFSVGESGLMNTLFFVGYMLGRLGVSRLSKHFGLKKTFIITELIMGALIFTLLLVDNPIIISIIIVLLGVTTRGTSPILKAMLSHSINEKHSLEDSMAFYQVCGNATTMIGRLIFGAVANSFGVISVFGVIITSVALSIVPISKYEDDD